MPGPLLPLILQLLLLPYTHHRYHHLLLHLLLYKLPIYLLYRAICIRRSSPSLFLTIVRINAELIPVKLQGIDKG